jgi:hypothetical protein
VDAELSVTVVAVTEIAFVRELWQQPQPSLWRMLGSLVYRHDVKSFFFGL